MAGVPGSWRLRFLQEGSTQRVLGIVGRPFQWEVPLRAVDERRANGEVERRIGQGDGDRVPATSRPAQGERQVRAAGQQRVVLGFADEVQPRRFVERQAECPFESLADMEGQDDVRNGGVDIGHDAAVEQLRGPAARLCHLERLQGHDQVTRGIGAQAERRIVRFEARAVEAAKDETTEDLVQLVLVPCRVAVAQTRDQIPIPQRPEETRDRILEIGEVRGLRVEAQIAELKVCRSETSNDLIV